MQALTKSKQHYKEEWAKALKEIATLRQREQVCVPTTPLLAISSSPSEHNEGAASFTAPGAGGHEEEVP